MAVSPTELVACTALRRDYIMHILYMHLKLKAVAKNAKHTYCVYKYIQSICVDIVEL